MVSFEARSGVAMPRWEFDKSFTDGKIASRFATLGGPPG